MSPARDQHASLYPYLVTLAAIGLLSLMDVLMKSASIAIGAYSALLLRSGIAVALIAPAWFYQGGKRPRRDVMKIHLVRGTVVTLMALTFFSALVHLPLAEAIALSFISPLIALALASIVLKESIGKKSILAAMLGLAGVIVIVGGRIGNERMTDEAALGIVLVLVSAVLYAWNLILQRQQALVAKPVEITTFQNAIVGTFLLLGAPFFFTLPTGGEALTVAGAAILSASGALMLAWSYARAEAQVLVPVEYTGFLWAALFGWLFLSETVSLTTLAGAVLIIFGCWIAAPRKHTEQATV